MALLRRQIRRDSRQSTPTALARNALRPNGRVEKRAGTAAIQGLRGIDIFDMRGRNLGSLPR